MNTDQNLPFLIPCCSCCRLCRQCKVGYIGIGKYDWCQKKPG